MNARTILAKLRHRQSPNRDELVWFAQALADGRVSDAQAGGTSIGGGRYNPMSSMPISLYFCTHI